MIEVTVMPLAGTGAGKSSNGNAFLQKADAFKTSFSSKSETVETIIKSSIINGIIYYYIDNPGFFTTEVFDEEFIEQMVEYIKKCGKGINSFFITINGVNPRFDMKLKLMMKLVNYFFNDPELWKHSAIVYTFSNCLNSSKKEILRNQYRQDVIDYIKTLNGCQNLDLEMKCFFVDSEKFDDPNSKDEFDNMRKFASQLPPVSTNNMLPVNPDYIERKVTEITVLTDKKINNINDDKQIITFYYEKQEDVTITDWNGKITHETPKVLESFTKDEIREYEFSDNNLVNIEYQKEKTVKHYEDRKRLKIIDQNGNVEFKDWITYKTKIVEEEYEYDNNYVEQTYSEKGETIKVIVDRKRLNIKENGFVKNGNWTTYNKRKMLVKIEYKDTFIRSETKGNGTDEIKTEFYQKWKRTNLINFEKNGEIEYGDWEKDTTWHKTISKIRERRFVREERKIEYKKVSVYSQLPGFAKFFSWLNPLAAIVTHICDEEIPDYEWITTYYQNHERDIITSSFGETNYTEWRKVGAEIEEGRRGRTY